MKRSESLSSIEPLSNVPLSSTLSEAAQTAAQNWLNLKKAQKTSLNIYLKTHGRGKKKAATIIIIGGVIGGGLASAGVVWPPLFVLGGLTFIFFMIGAGIAAYNENSDFKKDAKKAYEQSFGSHELLYMLSDPEERSYEDPADKRLAEQNKQDLPNVLEQTTVLVGGEETQISLKTLALTILSNLFKNENLDPEDLQLILETLLLRYEGCEQWRFYEVNQEGTTYLRSKIRPAISANHAAADQIVDVLVDMVFTNNQPKKLAQCLDYLMEKISKIRTDKIPLAVKTLITRLNNKLETNPDFAKHVFAAMKIDNQNRFLSLSELKKIKRSDRVIKDTETSPKEKKFISESSYSKPNITSEKSIATSNVGVMKKIGIFASEKANEVAAFFRKLSYPGTPDERQGLLMPPAHDVESPSSESDESFKGPTN